MFKIYWSILFLATIASCGMFNKSGAIKEKKVIQLFSAIPVNTIAIRLKPGNTFTCYFDRKEWRKEVDKLTTDSIMKSEYFSILDSLQKEHGAIPVEEIPICADNPECLNPYAVTGTIIYNFFLSGHVCIEYKRGRKVESMIYEKEIKDNWKWEYFRDKKTHRVIDVYSTPARIFLFYMFMVLQFFNLR